MNNSLRRYPRSWVNAVSRWERGSKSWPRRSTPEICSAPWMKLPERRCALLSATRKATAFASLRERPEQTSWMLTTATLLDSRRHPAYSDRTLIAADAGTRREDNFTARKWANSNFASGQLMATTRCNASEIGRAHV